MIYITDFGNANVELGNRIEIPDSNPVGLHYIDYNKNILTLDGVDYVHPKTEFQCEYEMYILAANQRDTPLWFGNMKLHYCQIYDDGILIRDYIPMIQNNKSGLYDKITNKFYEVIQDESFLGL